MSPLRPLPRPTPTVAALLSSVQTPRHTARPSERCGNMARPGRAGSWAPALRVPAPGRAVRWPLPRGKSWALSSFPKS